MTLPLSLSRFADVIIDSYFVIDTDRNIVGCNRAFASMLPRSLARNIKTKKCHEVLQLGICQKRCIAKQCWDQKRQVRLDEITGQIAGEPQQLRFILSCIPIVDDDDRLIGALEVQRNVTDEALVQAKYQKQMEASAARESEMEQTLLYRTRRLLEVSRRLYQAQRELLRNKTELLG